MLTAILQGKGYSVTYREHPGGHAALYWMQTLPDAMVQMLGKNPKR
jgi:enterochelin esterase-like enzyme